MSSNEYEMSGEDYELLYAKYLTRSPNKLLEYGGMTKGFVVMDLCCGSNARATKAAFNMGAKKVIAIDENPYVIYLARMNGFNVSNKNIGINEFGQELIIKQASIVSVIEDIPENSIDLVICQQGINYWFCELQAKMVAKTIRTGGEFVFNTFREEPSKIPFVKEYMLNDRKYIEVTHLNGDMVEHSIHVEGACSHNTRFKWIAPQEYKRVLEKLFRQVTAYEDKGTDIYVCEK